jgi:dienelactone hydrolase
MQRLSALLIAFLLAGSSVQAQLARWKTLGNSPGDKLLEKYFALETAKLEKACLADVKTLADWKKKQKTARKQMFEMLGLDPLPERTPLKPVVTGKVDHAEFTVEKLYFQSRPHLYVTGNLYVPKKHSGKLPAVLYVCGHARVKKNGVSYGNKAFYQHHGAWFARNGYVCLVIDTLQLGEIEGIHHGTYNHKMWWWNARGYSSAAVEAWNCIRALDYLQSRPEVDGAKLGVTGRSGGGAYSWWISALDERIQCAVPVAGIASLKNHVVDGCVEGHCDCMFPVNTYRWDFAEIAALVAPRPLLISNSDKDDIFPLDGVVGVYTKARRIYELYGKRGNIGLQISEGPHKDTQELRVAAFHWFNRHLKGKDPLIETTAVKLFQPEQLKVFKVLPKDEINTKIQETFVPKAGEPKVPATKEEWTKLRDGWMNALREKSFRGWPTAKSDPDAASVRVAGPNLKPAFSADHDGIHFAAYDFTSQEPFRLRLYIAHRAGLKPSDLQLVVLNALDEKGWQEFVATMSPGFADQFHGEKLPPADKQGYEATRKMFKAFKWGMAYVAPRGIGPTAWNGSERKQTQIRRRFMLLGQTRDGMQTYDVVRAAAALRSVPGFTNVPLWMQGEREMAGITLYASLFTPNVHRLDLHHLPHSHREGPIYLNVLRYLDTPAAVAMAAERSQVRIYQADKRGWEYAAAVAEGLGWGKKRVEVRVVGGVKK